MYKLSIRTAEGQLPLMRYEMNACGVLSYLHLLYKPSKNAFPSENISDGELSAQILDIATRHNVIIDIERVDPVANIDVACDSCPPDGSVAPQEQAKHVEWIRGNYPQYFGQVPA